MYICIYTYLYGIRNNTLLYVPIDIYIYVCQKKTNMSFPVKNVHTEGSTKRLSSSARFMATRSASRIFSSRWRRPEEKTNQTEDPMR